MAWRRHIITSQDQAIKIAGEAKRVAVLGIKPEDKASQPAHYVPAFLQSTGVEIIPVPTYYPDVKTILGQPVYRAVKDIGGPQLDVVDVFRKPEDLADHLDDILAARPKVVWLQSGITQPKFEEELAKEGIDVVPDRCLKVDRQRARMSRI